MSRLSRMLILTLIAASPVTAEDAILLKPKYEVGRTRYIENHISMDMTQSMGQAQGVKGSIERTFGAMQEVKEGSESGGKWQMTFDRVAQDFKFSGMTALFDSDDPNNEDASPSLAAFVKPMLGMSLNLKIGADGEISSCEGMKEIVKKISARGPSTFSMMMLPEMTDDRAKSTWGDSLLILYPNKKVKVGDTWKKSVEVTAPKLGKITSQYDCKLDKITEQGGRKVAVVEYHSTSRIADSPADVAADKADDDKKDDAAADKDSASGTKKDTKPAEPTSKLDGKSTGRAVFDVETCELLSRTDNGSVVIQMSMAPGGPKMTIEQTIKTQVTIFSETDRKKAKAEIAKKVAAEKAAQKDDDKDDEKSDDKDENEDKE